MSDRRNRDRGRKKEHQANRPECDCWYCMGGAEKKRIQRDRANRKELRKELGYSRIGLGNV